MYAITHITSDKWQENTIINEYVANLPHHPYCTDSKGYSMIRSKNHAIKHAYIQPNQVAKASYIIIDIDHADATHQALSGDVPPPHLIIQNPHNCHAHLVYKLSSPVFLWGKAKSKPIRYLARIERGLIAALGGDAGYGGNLMKNPVSPVWRTYATTAPLEGYSLEYLAKFVNLDNLHDVANDAGYSRNCTLFDDTRQHGYNFSPASYNALVTHLTPIATEYNQRFDVPLFHNEVMHVVRSIARYCTRNDFTASHKAFSERQRARVTKRWGDNTDKQKQAQIWAAEGVKIGVIAERLSVSPRTLTRWGIQKKKK